jgi:hypothetical protein
MPLSRIHNVRIIRDGALVQDDLWFEDGKIVDPQQLFFATKRSPDHVIDGCNCIIAPGFIELQINGKIARILARILVAPRVLAQRVRASLSVCTRWVRCRFQLREFRPRRWFEARCCESCEAWRHRVSSHSGDASRSCIPQSNILSLSTSHFSLRPRLFVFSLKRKDSSSTCA